VKGRRDIERLQSELDELFEDLWQVPRFAGVRRGFRPSVDVYRTDDPRELTVVVELPGVDPDLVHVALEGHDLVIGGQRTRPKVGCRPSYYHLEIEYGRFQRRVRLPEEVVTADVHASYEHGLLKIVLPIASKPVPTGKVSIKVSEGP
jgi:HSP20 family protein